MAENNGRRRIVVTGGPGGGKTTASDLFRRELGEQVVVVPEAATMLFGGGFPRYDEANAVRSTQRAIYHVQRNLEEVQTARFPDRILICDRGTLDGAAYWPNSDGLEGFADAVGTTVEAELARYDGVIFFQTAAAGGIGIIENGNPVRNESQERAVEVDRALQAVWSRHPHYYFVPHHASFFRKLTSGFGLIESLVARLSHR